MCYLLALQALERSAVSMRLSGSYCGFCVAETFAAWPRRPLYVSTLQDLGRYDYSLTSVRTVCSSATVRVGDAAEADQLLMVPEGTVPDTLPGTLLGTSKKEGEKHVNIRSDIRSDARSDV